LKGADVHFVCPDGDPQYRGTIEAAVVPLLADAHTFAWYEGTPTSVNQWRDRCQEADGLLLLLHLPGDAMRALERLRVVSWTGTGVGRYVDVPLAAQLGVTVCNVPSYGANAIAEHALGLMLAAARGIGRGDRLIRAGGWAQHGGPELRGAQLGVVGVGPIGQRMVEIGQALGMATVAWTNRPTPERARELNTTFVPLPELMQTSDFVSVHVAHTAETEGLLSREMLALLPAHAVLVNTARGEVIDQQALIELLDSGRIAGAGLDVFTPEPPAPGDSVLACDRAVLTPHVAYDTPASTAELFRRAADNLHRFAQGAPANVVRVAA
jgi:phosphoglycerate dehydrogenase-like enzyme